MTVDGRAIRCLAAALLGLAVASVAHAGEAGAAQSPPPELAPPGAQSLRAFDRPSDSGSTVAVEWAVSPADHPSRAYLVEITPQSESQRLTALRPEDVHNWGGFPSGLSWKLGDLAEGKGPTVGTWLWGLLSEAARQKVKDARTRRAMPPADEAAIVEELDAALSQRTLPPEAVLKDLDVHPALGKLLTADRADMPEERVRRLNRILLEAAFPAHLAQTHRVVPAAGGLKAAAPKYFGFRSHLERYHYVGITPADLYPPDKEALRPGVVARQSRHMGRKWNPDADCRQRLAALAAATAAARDGVKSIAAAKGSPDAGAQALLEAYLQSIDALVEHLDQLTEDFDGENRPRIAETSFLPILDDLDKRLNPALRARDACRDALGGGDGTLSARLDDLERGFLHQFRRYRAYARRLRKFDSYVGKELADLVRQERRRINRQPYTFRLAITDGERLLHVEDGDEPKVVTGRAGVNAFKGFKLNNLAFSLIFSAIVVAFIRRARRDPNLFIRKIAGLEAVEEAIGRATEMGRSAFFIHGLTGMASLSTIASVNILGRVARRAAEYDTRVRVMNRHPIVMAVSQEVVKQSYTEAGRPDAYNEDDVSLVAYDQFSYVAAISGRMVRERPAAIFLMGYFYAESLLLAETGASTGAIQIAGTDSYTQIPFFITTCDYTLIGEELFAASAYLSREPKMLGSLRGQDVGKAFLMIVIVVSTGLASAGAWLGAQSPAFQNFVTYWVKTLFQPF